MHLAGDSHRRPTARPLPTPPVSPPQIALSLKGEQADSLLLHWAAAELLEPGDEVSILHSAAGLTEGQARDGGGRELGGRSSAVRCRRAAARLRLLRALGDSWAGFSSGRPAQPPLGGIACRCLPRRGAPRAAVPRHRLC